MSPRIHPLTVMALMATLACEGPPTRPVTPSSNPPAVELGLQPGASIRIPDHPWLITLVAVAEDSRCPETVQCPWEGTALVRFRLERFPPGGAAPVDVEIRLDGWVDFEGMRLQLKELRPGTIAGQATPLGAYRAVLEVRPANTVTAP